MFRNFCLPLLVVAAQSTSMAATLELSLSSGPCAYSRASGWQSSGAVFRVEGRPSKIYVIASSERVFEPAKGAEGAPTFCHQGVMPSGEEISLTPLASDWARGIALLEGSLPDSIDGAIVPELPLQPPSTPRIGSPATLKGVPGQLLSNRSDRHLLPALSRVWEWQTSQSMGSDVVGRWLSHGATDFLGMVSHQYLLQRPGKKAFLGAWPGAGNAPPQSHLVVIPASDILPWVRSVLEGTHIPPHFSRDAELEWQGRTVLRVAGLEFEADCPPQKPSTEPINGAYPIGGNDGVGIGGSITQDRLCIVKIRSSIPAPGAAHAEDTAPFPLDGRSAWLNEVRQALRAVPELSVWYWARSENLGNGITHTPAGFGSLSEFFTDFTDSALTPVWFGGQIQNQLFDTATFLADKTVWAWNGTFMRTYVTEELAGRWFFFAKVMASQTPLLITPEEMREWLPGARQRDWNEMGFNNPRVAELKNAAEKAVAERERQEPQ